MRRWIAPLFLVKACDADSTQQKPQYEESLRLVVSDARAQRSQVPILEAVLARNDHDRGHGKGVMSEERTTRRVELPVLCKYLRCKSGYGAIEYNAAWQLGTSTTEA